MNFFLDVLLYGAGIFALVYFIYVQFFSEHERLRRLTHEQKPRPRFERRQTELGDRRKGEHEPVDPENKREGPRRDRDR